MAPQSVLSILVVITLAAFWRGSMILCSAELIAPLTELKARLTASSAGGDVGAARVDDRLAGVSSLPALPAQPIRSGAIDGGRSSRWTVPNLVSRTFRRNPRYCGVEAEPRTTPGTWRTKAGGELPSV